MPIPSSTTLSPPPLHSQLSSASPCVLSPSLSNKRKAPLPAAQPPAPKKSVLSLASQVPKDLGEYIARDVKLLQQLGWHQFVKQRRPRSDFANLANVHHPARRLLQHYKSRGAPVKFSTPPWSSSAITRALHRGPHKSCHEYVDFLREEFTDMIAKGQWVVLPASVAQTLPGLRLSPPGVVPQRDRRPRWIGDYSWWDVNSDTLPLAAMEAMQFGHALDRILREILLSNPEHGPVHLIKVDISDGFYRVDLNIDDIPKLGLIFPTEHGEEPLVAFPLVLPMGWKNSPPIFSTATETIADLANQRLLSNIDPLHHPLDDLAHSIPSPSPFQPPSPPAVDCSPVGRDSLLPSSPPSVDVSPDGRDTLPLSPASVDLSPVARDPSLPFPKEPLSYIDVFVDDFIGLAQHQSNCRRVRRILLTAIDDVFRPNDHNDSPARREPVSLKKLRQGDCSWGTIKLVLGWIIDTINMTIHLPSHRVERLAEILASVPVTQKRTSVKKWHQLLGELRSMSLALPGSRNIFSTMQNALTLSSGSRVALNKGVHDALNDFRWMHANITSRPTRIAELVPLDPVAEGHHDASGTGAGGIWFPGPSLVPREGFQPLQPLLWRYEWPDFIKKRLVSSDNPSGTISNSDLELAGGLLHLEALTQTFDITERTVLSKGDNLSTTFWERKGSTSSNKPPAYLLRMFGIHQRHHRYIPRFDYISGPSNPIADACSRDFHLSWPSLIDSLSSYLPQNSTYQIWTPSEQILSVVTSALLRKRCSPESQRIVPPKPTLSGPSGVTSVLTWASTPFSKPSKTKFLSYKSSLSEFVPANLRPEAIPSGLDRLKITYGTLPRRSYTWGPSTRV